MLGQTSFMEEIDCGSFFDHIDDLIDFPVVDVAETVASGNTPAQEDLDLAFSGDVWPSQCDSLPPSAADLSAELSVPYEDIVQLEWLSNFVEDSFSGGGMQPIIGGEESVGVNHGSSRNQFQTSSPVSVLESSSSCSGEKTSPRSPEVAPSQRCGRARSKRPRPATFTPRPAMQISNSLSSASELLFTPKAQTYSESCAESRLVIKIPKTAGDEQKKKKFKISVPSASNQSNFSSFSQQQTIRKCMHCEITKTPQWRAGPMGPKTLCNACGVRFKSGRLFPEYRPAASPTFVPSLHSNSHKKVLEMRNKGCDSVNIRGEAMMMTNNLIPNKSNIAFCYV